MTNCDHKMFWINKSKVEKRWKEKQWTDGSSRKQKTVDFNPKIQIIILNVKSLKTPVKR